MARKEMTPKELAWEAWKASALSWDTRIADVENFEKREKIEFEKWWSAFNKIKK